MSKWTKSEFGVDSFESVGIVFAGTMRREFEEKILELFDSVESSTELVSHNHIVSIKGKKYPFVTNVYGAPAMVDTLAVLREGGCRNVVFIGTAYGGFQDLEVGTVSIPSRSHHFDGVFHLVEPKEFSNPDKELHERVKKIFPEAKVGINISVPAVTFQPPHNCEAYKKIEPMTLEMELAACFSRAEEIGIRSAGILIVSDNKTSSLGDKNSKKRKYLAKISAVKNVIEHVEEFALPELPSNFSINKYLADVIHNPDDDRNVYREP